MNQHVSDCREIRSGSQTGLNQILSERIHSLEAPITGKQSNEIQNTEQKRKQNGANHEYQRIPDDAEGEMRDVERQGGGIAVKSAVGPHEPGGEPDQEGGADRR